MKKQIKVLVTGIGTVAAQGFIKGVRQQDEFDLYLVSTDAREDNAGRYFTDKFYKVPRGDNPNYVTEIMAICKKEKIDLLLPGADGEVMALAQNKQLIEKETGTLVVVSNFEGVNICDDKYLAYTYFKQHHFDTVPTFLLDEAIKKVEAGELPFPLFIKPRIGTGSKHTHIVHTLEELKEKARQVPIPIVQTYLGAWKEFSVDVAADFNGRVLGVVPRTREEVRYGAAYRGVTVKDPLLITMAKEVVEQMGLVGPINVQIFKNLQTGEALLFEINPRIGATHAHTIASGLNTPYLILKLFNGEKIEPKLGAFKEGLWMYRHWDEVFVEENGQRLPRTYRLV